MRLHDVLISGSFSGKYFKSVKVKRENKKDLLIDHEFYVWMFGDDELPPSNNTSSEVIREHLDMFDSEKEKQEEIKAITEMIQVGKENIEMFDVYENGNIEISIY